MIILSAPCFFQGAEISFKICIGNKRGELCQKNANIITCPRGHRYDSLLYDQGCPICYQERVNQQKENTESTGTVDLIHGKNTSSISDEPDTRNNNPQLFQDGDLSKEETKILNAPAKSRNCQKTFRDSVDDEETRILDSRSTNKAERAFSSLDRDAAETVILKQNEKPETANNERNTRTERAEGSLEINALSVPDENKTMLFYNQRKYVMEPVYGWLVCFDGVDRGRDFRLLAGMNRVGRFSDDERGINLSDTSISRDESAAIIAFDPRNKQFLISPGKNNQAIVLVNESTLMRQNLLSAFDVVTIGNSSFIFIPLCGDRFLWKDEESK